MVFVNLFTLSRWWCANQNSDSVSCVPVRFHLLCWRLFLWFIPIGYCFIYEYLWINCNNIIIEDPSHSIAESCSCQYENASQFYYMLSILYSLFYSLFLFVSSELKSNCFILFRCCWLLLKFYFDRFIYENFVMPLNKLFNVQTRDSISHRTENRKCEQNRRSRNFNSRFQNAVVLLENENEMVKIKCVKKTTHNLYLDVHSILDRVYIVVVSTLEQI